MEAHSGRFPGSPEKPKTLALQGFSFVAGAGFEPTVSNKLTRTPPLPHLNGAARAEGFRERSEPVPLFDLRVMSPNPGVPLTGGNPRSANPDRLSPLNVSRWCPFYPTLSRYGRGMESEAREVGSAQRSDLRIAARRVPGRRSCLEGGPSRLPPQPAAGSWTTLAAAPRRDWSG